MQEKTSRPLGVYFRHGGVCVLESHHDDDFRMDWTVHGFVKMLYVHRGSGRLLLEKGSLGLRAGWLAFVPEGTKHRIADDPGKAMSLYVLCVRSELLDAYREGGEKCQASSHSVLSRMAERLLRDVLYEQTMQKKGSEAACAARVLELWAAWVRRQDEGRKRVTMSRRGMASQSRVREYLAVLDGAFYRQETLEEAARATGLSIRRFTQLFRAEAGRSWHQEVRVRQIAHARRLLDSTQRSVAAVCFECGFSDLSTFYRAFKEAEGMSPQRWREKRSRTEKTKTIR